MSLRNRFARFSNHPKRVMLFIPLHNVRFVFNPKRVNLYIGVPAEIGEGGQVTLDGIQPTLDGAGVTIL